MKYKVALKFKLYITIIKVQIITTKTVAYLWSYCGVKLEYQLVTTNHLMCQSQESNPGHTGQARKYNTLLTTYVLCSEHLSKGLWGCFELIYLNHFEGLWNSIV